MTLSYVRLDLFAIPNNPFLDRPLKLRRALVPLRSCFLCPIRTDMTPLLIPANILWTLPLRPRPACTEAI